MNPVTFPELPLNSYSLATSTCMFGCTNAAAPSASPNPACAMIACSAASCFYCCLTTCSRLTSCQLMVYGGSGDSVVDSAGNDDVGGGVGSGD